MNNTETNSDLKDSVADIPSRLDVYVTAALLGRSIVNEVKQQLKMPLRRANLTMNQWLALKLLFLNRANTASKIATMMNVDSPSITRSLDILELRGHIERVHQTKDRRVVLLQLTPKGLRITQQMYASYAGILEHLDQRLTQDELTLWGKVEECIAAHISDTRNR